MRNHFVRYDSALIEPFDVDDRVHAGRYSLQQRLSRNSSVSPRLSAGDIDAQWEMAESVGDEAAGGSAPTPDQNVVEEVGDAVGVIYQASEELHCGEKEIRRDAHRWELDPASAEDYRERTSRTGARKPRATRFLR